MRESITWCVSLLFAGSMAASSLQESVCVTRLIHQLTSPKFSERDAASKALNEMGKAVLPALRKAATEEKSLETRRRASQLINAIEARIYGPLRLLYGHTRPVASLAFTLDGKLLSSASVDQTVRLWKVSTSKELRKLTNTGIISSASAFSADGKVLAAYSADGSIVLCEVMTAKLVKKFQRDREPVRALAFTPDGKTIASCGENSVKLWEVTSGKAKWQIDQRGSIFGSLAFTADGKTLASVLNRDRIVKLFEVATGKELRTLHGHEKPITSVLFLPDGKTLITGGLDGTLRFWEVATGAPLRMVKTHLPCVVCVKASQDGKVIAAAVEAEPNQIEGHRDTARCGNRQ